MRALHCTTLLAVAFLAIQHLHAQNSSPYWSLAGNSNASTSSKLGTTNGIPLRILTKNLERMRIDTAGRVGIGMTNPAARLVVNTPSGTAAFVVQIGGSTKLFMHSNGGLAVGSSSTPPATGLYVKGNVGIGTATPAYKLHVEGGSNEVAIYGNCTSSIGYGVYGHNSSTGYGVYGTCSSGYGVYGSGGTGVYGSGTTGVYGITTKDAGNAVFGEAYAAAAYGVYAYSEQSLGIYAHTGNASAYAGFFGGNVYATGMYLPSDATLKQDIVDLNSGMAIIAQLKPKSYTYRQDGNYKLLNLPSGTRYGLLAQDLEQAMPSLVKATSFDVGRAKQHQTKPEPGEELTATATQPAEAIDFKAVNYTELIPIMVKGMQEQEAEIKAKDERITALENDVAELRQMVLDLKNGSTNTLTFNSTYLEQNTPNPVSGTTTIRYHLPTGTTSAVLNITNVKGQLVKSIRLTGDLGQVELNTTALASGTYNYSLYVDRKQVDSKRLIVAR